MSKIKEKCAERPVAGGPRRKREVRSNLIDMLVAAREAEYRSVPNLAEMAGVTPDAVATLEKGRGPVTTLVAVMDALPFQVKGLAPGQSFAEQLRHRREKKGLSLEAVAAKTSLPPQKIAALESGRGSVQDLLRLLAVIAPKVSRRAPERAYWGAGNKADRDSRFTPASFMEPVYRAFGEIDLDPCAHPSSPVVAHRRFMLANGDDGLSDPWSGRFVFMNPPFSALLNWLRRAYDQWAAGNVRTVVCLVPVRTDSAFFHEEVKTAADIYFLRGRIPFLDGAGKAQVTPFSLMVVTFGATEQQKIEFASRVPGFWVRAEDGTMAQTLEGLRAMDRGSSRRRGEHPRGLPPERVSVRDCRARSFLACDASGFAFAVDPDCIEGQAHARIPTRGA